jgi:hypothetical protein
MTMMKQAQAISMALRMLRPGFHEQFLTAIAAKALLPGLTTRRRRRKRHHRAKNASDEASTEAPIPKERAGSEFFPVRTAARKRTSPDARPPKAIQVETLPGVHPSPAAT